MGRIGCDMVSVVGMPVAALARELDLSYTCCADIANRAEGCGNGSISVEEIEVNLTAGMDSAGKLLEEAIPEVTGDCCEIST